MAGSDSSASTCGREWLTVAEILQILADEHGRPLPRRTWQQWRAEGKTPVAIRLPNGQLRIRRADFEVWLAGLAEQPKRGPH
jgi:hypothetical protein